jgi:sulfate transport system substrate-binding protein
LLPKDWQAKLPDNSAPYTSTIVFVVRKGNPKGVKDWGDLVKPGVGVITPNPKTSGGARWNYLAAWAWAEKAFSKDEAKVLDYMTRLFRNVPVLDTGARGSTTTFAQRQIGDVFLSWENEACLIEKEFPGQTEVVYPSLSILAEPPVAVVEKNAGKHGTAAVSEAYLKFLYTDEAQKLAGKHFYRPRNKQIAGQFVDKLPALPLVTIDADFGGWAAAQKTHFADGGTFDRIYSAK